MVVNGVNPWGIALHKVIRGSPVLGPSTCQMLLQTRVAELVSGADPAEQAVSVGVIQEGHEPPGQASAKREPRFGHEIATPDAGTEAHVPIGQAEANTEDERVGYRTAYAVRQAESDA